MEFLHSKFTKMLYLLFGVVFLISGLTINILQFFLYISLNRLNKHVFRRINYYLNYSLFSQIVYALQYWADVKVMLHVNKKDFDCHFGKENVLLIMNHTYEIDWMIGWILCDNCKVLGNCKTFAKKSIQYIPTLGFSWKVGESIFLERVWDKDRNTFVGKLEELMSFKDQFWLLLTAEGTRFTPEKHEASKAFAKKHGLPELRHHLLPRTKGFTTAFPYMRKTIPAIYSINIGVRPNEVEPSFRNILLGKSIKAGIFVERFPMEDLPEGEEELAAWLHGLYKRKDDVLHSYLETGSWFELSNVEQCESFVLPRRIHPAINFAVWCAIVLIPLAYFLINLCISGNLVALISVLAIVATMAVFFEKIVAETKMSQSSKYGIKNSGTRVKAE